MTALSTEAAAGASDGVSTAAPAAVSDIPQASVPASPPLDEARLSAVNERRADDRQDEASERWTATSHSTRLANGHQRVELYTEPTFRRGPDGWTELSADVVQRGGRPVAPNSARPLTFGDSADEVVRIDLGPAPVSLALPGLDVGRPSTEGSVVTYESVAQDTDLRFEVQTSGVVEEFVLESAAAPRVFVTDLVDPEHRLGTPQRQDDGSYRFSTVFPDGMQLAVLRPYAYEEASGRGSASYEAASLTVTETDEGYQVEKSIDEVWLHDAVYPVVLDPWIVLWPAVDEGYNSDGWATGTYCGLGGLYGRGPFYNNDSFLRAGKVIGETGTWTTARGYLAADMGEWFEPGTEIVSAQLDLGWYADAGSFGNEEYEILRHDGRIADVLANGCELFYGPQTPTGSVSTGIDANWDITSLVQDWVNEPQFNGGLIIAPMAGASSADAWSSSHGPRKPALIIEYVGPMLPGAFLLDEQVQGDASSCTTVSPSQLRADPINTGTGHLVEAATDVDLEGGALPLRLRRSYDSGRTVSGALGAGWAFGFEAELAYDSATGRALLHTGAANTVGFARQPDGSFLPDVGVTASLTVASGGYEVLMDCSGVSMSFDADGALTSITGQDSGYELTVQRNTDGNPALVADSDGRSISFTYASGLLERVDLSDGRFVTYGYTDGRLTSVTTLDGTVVSYGYDPEGRLTRKSAGTLEVTTTYDPTTGRVASQADGAGATTTFSWDPASQTATTTYPRGGVATDVYHGNLLIKTVDANGSTTRYEYDANGQLSAVIDPLARRTTLTYDAAGLLLERIGPAPDYYREAWTYDDAGRVLTETNRNGKTSTYTYDADGLLATVTDALGRVTSYTHVDGRLASVTDPRGNLPGADPADFTTTYTYDANGYPQTVTDPLGRTTTTVYDSLGHVASRTDPAGGTTTFTYDALGRVLTVTEPRGNVTGANAVDFTTTNTYDDLGNLTSVTDALGQVTTYAYDEEGKLTSVTAPGARVTTLGYDLDDNLISVADPLGATTTYTYDLGGRRTSMTTPRGNALPAGQDRTPYTWTYGYDAAGKVTRVENPSTGPHLTQYDTYDRITRSFTPNSKSGSTYSGVATRWTYDGLGNVLSETTNIYANAQHDTTDWAGPGATTTYAYDDAGQLVGITDPRGNLPGADPAQYTTTFTYDAAGHQTAVTDPLGFTRTAAYDAADQLVRMVDPRGNVAGANPDAYATTYEYDGAGRQTATTTPSGARATYTFDVAGNLVAVTEPRGNVPGATPAAFTTTYTVDPLGRVQAEVAPGGATTEYTFDEAGNVLTHTDANDHTTTFTYDLAGRRLTKTSPIGQLWTNTYDADGNVTTEVTPLGTSTTTQGDGTITYQYDPAGRLTDVDYSDNTPDVTYVYRLDGSLWGANTTAGENLQYDRDDRGRLTTLQIQSLDANSYVSYLYDDAGYLTSRQETSSQNPQLVTTDYTYDRAGNVTAVGTGATQVQLSYDPAGNLTTLTPPTGNGYAETRSYDVDGRLTGVTNARGTNVLSSFTQTFDAASNPITLAIRSGGTTTPTAYTYDLAGRLTKACYAASCTGAASYIQYDYDSAGNRISEGRVGVATPGTTTYTYDAADRLLSTRIGTTTTNYGYDANGNQTTAGARAFTYDLANRVTSTTYARATTTYTYDAQGNRRTQTSGRDVTRYVWDTRGGIPLLLQENTGTGTTLRRYTYAPGGDPLTMTTSGAVSYYHHDQLGGITNVTSDTGATQHTYTYEPFGAARSTTSASKAPANPLRFAGQYLDASGLYNLRARLYNPAIGQFTALDPLVDSTGRAYAYARNNPLRYADPTGTIDCDYYSDACAVGSWLKGAGSGLVDSVKTFFYPWDAIDALMARCAQPGLYGALDCVDALNPIAQARDGFTGTWDAVERGCIEDAGRAFTGAELTVGLLVAPFANGVPRGAPSAAAPAAAPSSAAIGFSRVERVVAQFAGDVVDTGRFVTTRFGSTDIDVVLSDGTFIEVGGPAKGANLAKFGQQLQRVAAAAEEAGGRALFMYDEGTPQAAIDLALKWFGPGGAGPIG